MTLSRSATAMLFVLVLLGMPVAALGQGTDHAPDERTYGIDTSVSLTIPAVAFHGLTPGVTYMLNNRFSQHCVNTLACAIEAPVSLPAGALITSIQMDLCDTGAQTEVRASLQQVLPSEGAAPTVLATSISGVGTAPGCTVKNQNLAAPHTVDNAGSAYIISARLSSVGPTFLNANTRLVGVRVFYRLQVTPAPAVATFNDVPTNHPFFRFVQALVAAGITSGCSASPPLFCPDDPVTRKQMAAFIAKALGLHFSP